jgi:predicted nucleic acid-binding protein
VLRLTELTEIVTVRRLGASSLGDREDAKTLECAFSGESDYIVAGDRSLLSLNRNRRVKIVSPSRFATILRNNTTQND